MSSLSSASSWRHHRSCQSQVAYCNQSVNLQSVLDSIWNPTKYLDTYVNISCIWVHFENGILYQYPRYNKPVFVSSLQRYRQRNIPDRLTVVVHDETNNSISTAEWWKDDFYFPLLTIMCTDYWRLPAFRIPTLFFCTCSFVCLLCLKIVISVSEIHFNVSYPALPSVGLTVDNVGLS